MSTTQRDTRIRILLLDDRDSLEPQGGLPPQYAKCFDIRWLSSPAEARAYRDASWLCQSRKPELLGIFGWVPEIFAIDYALTQEKKSVWDWVNQDSEKHKMLSPLPGLQDALSQVGIGQETLVLKGPPVTPPAGSEFWGCYIGGLILATFADYPVAAVSITRYGQDDFFHKAKDVAFFEWLMERQTSEQLKGSGKEGLTWSEIISDGTRKLQEKLTQLATVGMITLNLDELSTIASGKSQNLLTIQSRYGTRQIKVDGLFINDDINMRQSWADRLISNLVGDGKSSLLMQARSHAEELLKTYDNEILVQERIELSDLFLKMEKGTFDAAGADASRLGELKSQFAAVYQQEGSRINGEIQNMELIGDIRDLKLDNWTRKWTALSVIVLLLKRFCVGWSRGMRYEEISGPEIYLSLCPVARNPIILPFSEGSGRDVAADMQVDRKVGFSVQKVLAGDGLDGAERVLLRHLAHTLGLSSQLISEYPRVERFVKGQ
ncbi:MAG: hypothetical protein GX455_02095 [Phycisphaerae bacterium]|nr:hypothetical protein [Phycisphaerae bacterium]